MWHDDRVKVSSRAREWRAREEKEESNQWHSPHTHSQTSPRSDSSILTRCGINNLTLYGYGKGEGRASFGMRAQSIIGNEVKGKKKKGKEGGIFNERGRRIHQKERRKEGRKHRWATGNMSSGEQWKGERREKRGGMKECSPKNQLFLHVFLRERSGRNRAGQRTGWGNWASAMDDGR